MPYQISHTVQENVLRVEVTGERSRETLVESAQNAWSRIAQTCTEAGLTKIMIISSATGSYPTLEAYEINTNLSALGVKRGWKIAFVSLDPDSIENIRFGATFAVNRGG